MDIFLESEGIKNSLFSYFSLYNRIIEHHMIYLVDICINLQGMHVISPVLYAPLFKR
jgi:hypothetical protein